MLSPSDKRQYSVVVPAYNAERTIADCLRALAACRPQAQEIVVVDDCSSDRTPAIARGFDCKLLSLPRNVGAGAARNAGVRCATSSHIVFVDADVIVDPDLFARLDEFFVRRPEAAGVSGIYQANVPDDAFASRYKNLYSIVSCTTVPARPVAAMNTSLAAIRREALAEAGGFDERWPACEDTILAGAMAELGSTLYFSDGIRMRHDRSYTLLSLLRDDAKKSYWQARYLWGRSFAFWKNWREHSGHHSASEIVRLPLACAAAASAIAAVAGNGSSQLLFLICFCVFVALAQRLWRTLYEHEGAWFTLAAVPFHWLEMCVAATAVIAAGLAEAAASSARKQRTIKAAPA